MSHTLLAFETATHHCSVALYCQDKVIDRHQFIPQQHTQQVLPMVEALLAEANVSRTQLDGIAFGCGPGSFTGVRLATNLAQGIALALDLPVIPISTLRALAQQAWRHTGHSHILTALDARLKQIYTGYYQLNTQSIMMLCDAESVCHPENLQIHNTAVQWIGVGSGWDTYPTQLPNLEWLANYYPHAYDVATLASYHYLQGDIISPLEAKPCYIRNQVAHKKN